MRKRFEQQQELDATLIQDVQFDSRSRHELPKLLAGLQYIFVRAELNEQIFTIMESHVLEGKKSTGRLGMSLWEILVLGTMRLNLDIDYDNLQDLTNNHEKVRGMLGVDSKKVFSSGKYYAMQTLKDNVRLLTPELLEQISEVVVKAGHQLKKNESDEPIDLKFKSDSYVVESTIHFPTDLNLLWDSARKSLDTIGAILNHHHLSGWNKRNYWRRKVKSAYKRSSNIHHRRGKDYKTRLKSATGVYLDRCEILSEKVGHSLKQLDSEGVVNIQVFALETQLRYYQSMLTKHIDLVNRRILQDQQIPHEEKVFSIFEPHVEWVQKGKHHKKVELGHNVLITTDQFHFIVDHNVMVNQRDPSQPIELSTRLVKRFGEGYGLDSISFDKGFYSQLAYEQLTKAFNMVVMPKKGKLSKQLQQQYSESEFVALRNKHSAVESNINEVEHAGLNRVPDKGLYGFKKYVALGVLAYNLKRLGRIVIEKKLLPTVVPRGGLGKKAA